MAHPQVYLLYMPPGNAEAMVHYQDTILKGVPIAKVEPYVAKPVRDQIARVFEGRNIAVWGSQAGPKNLEKFDSMRVGDEVLIVEGSTIRLIGYVAAKVRTVELSRALWKPLKPGPEKPWELVYFIANARVLDVPFEQFNELFGFKPEFRLRGFTKVAAEKVDAFHLRYDDLYDVLVRLKSGGPIVQRVIEPIALLPAEEPSAPESAILDESVAAPEVSEHVRMQWTLATLGRRAGERIWIPASDQKRLEKVYAFNEYDAEFAPAIDVPYPFVKNIDVVWKHEFRIDAAYEVENSTAIYSGLLRFADLTIIAPNTIYPLFIVAPSSRRSQVREQLRRPAFQQLRLAEKVSFLSYEAVDEIDSFFSHPKSGLTVEVLKGRSEQLV